MGTLELLLVRHGESVGNLAQRKAEAAKADRLEVDLRDADVALSPLGLEQARAFGRWLREQDPDQRPQGLWVSTYARARETASTALEEAGLQLPTRVDERLRDRELGVLDMLTTQGMLARYPEEAERRGWLGKFYHRPPGGESWADVILRLRTWLADLERTTPHQRVLVVAHDMVILGIRYICEQLSEEEVLAIGKGSGVANASVTRLVREPDGLTWRLDVFNDQDHLTDNGTPTTDQPTEHDARAH
ncbi:histidine phosphatase family protein [Rhodococcus sp. X156]|uniref:histidine phosphatase family protein n=1 Tax=Rhodococcus sp. X156 TaxID=2499145 RepID=UPI000FDA4069|nr:histidine phosphatase family protein [Rhodococcus sp. X156]